MSFSGEDVLQRPSSVLSPGLPHQLDRLGETLVPRGVDLPEVIEPPEHIVMPPGRKCKFQEGRLDDIPGAGGPEEPVREKKLPPALLGAADFREARPAGHFEVPEPFENADRGMHRAVCRA